MMRRGKSKSAFLATSTTVAVFILVLIVAPSFISMDVDATDLSGSLRHPGEDGFLLGSDSVGRDVLMRTIAGGRESVILGLGVIVVVVALGVTAGLIGGYFGGVWDYVINKIVTAFQAFPSFVLAVAIAGILGQGLMNMIIAIAAVYWTQFARLSRSVVISFKNSDCLKAAKMCGAPTRSIIFRYLIPQVMEPVAIMAALSVSDIILTMAGLSFIGLGPERPTNEWGAMMAEAQPVFQYAIWCMLVPMAALLVAVVLFNLLGDTLRDALDSRSQTHFDTRYFSRRKAFKELRKERSKKKEGLAGHI